MKYRFSANCVKWFDEINGNTYHSVSITDKKTGKIIVCPFQYGYGEQYKHTAILRLIELKLLPKQYNKDNYYLYERENNYPILWFEYKGTKKACIANGKE